MSPNYLCKCYIACKTVLSTFDTFSTTFYYSGTMFSDSTSIASGFFYGWAVGVWFLFRRERVVTADLAAAYFFSGAET